MWVWISFFAIIAFFLALDLGVFHKTAHQVTTKEAVGWTTLWVSISLAFSGVVYWVYEQGYVENANHLTSTQAVLEYLIGYLVELSLSVDNVFVIAVIFSYFRVPRIYQHRVLFWGILGAVFFRALLIFAGIILIQKFSWVTYFFGLLLLYSAYKMLTAHPGEDDFQKNLVVRWIKKAFPVTKGIYGDRFFIRRQNIIAATPLFIVLMVIETSDILFAIDSIPAILAITTDPFLVFTSNIFAILGLRSMYFVLDALLKRFKYLTYSLTFILAFVGVKMLLLHYVHLPEWLSLAVILVALLAGIVASQVIAEEEEPANS
jgi:tellurite resistance protein TerC